MNSFSTMNPTATLNFPVPSALGTFDQYVSAVNKYPLLTLEQEQELGRRWKYTGSRCRTPTRDEPSEVCGFG